MGRGYLRALCIFHDDHEPSLVIYENSRRFECFGCGRSGTWEYLKKSMARSSYKTLASKHAISRQQRNIGSHRTVHFVRGPAFPEADEMERYCREAYRALREVAPARTYLEHRGLGEGIELGQLGWDNGWIVVPVRDRGGGIQGAVARSTPSLEHRGASRFTLPRGQGPMLYVPSWELWDQEVVFITFGIFDALSLAVAGFGSASPSSGKNSLNPNWLDEARKPIWIIPDRGEEETAWSYMKHLDWRGKVLMLDYQDAEKDVNDVLVGRGTAGLRELVWKHTKE